MDQKQFIRYELALDCVSQTKAILKYIFIIFHKFFKEQKWILRTKTKR